MGETESGKGSGADIAQPHGNQVISAWSNEFQTRPDGHIQFIIRKEQFA